MLIEAKTKVARIIDGKTRRMTETYVKDCEFFSEAEYAVNQILSADQEAGVVEGFEIQSLRISPIKEIDEASYNEADASFIATLRDLFHDDNGNEKQLKYKVLLWAESLTEANRKALELSHQGYDMLVEGIKQVDYIYLNSAATTNEEVTDGE